MKPPLAKRCGQECLQIKGNNQQSLEKRYTHPNTCSSQEPASASTARNPLGSQLRSANSSVARGQVCKVLCRQVLTHSSHPSLQQAPSHQQTQQQA